MAFINFDDRERGATNRHESGRAVVVEQFLEQILATIFPNCSMFPAIIFMPHKLLL